MATKKAEGFTARLTGSALPVKPSQKAAIIKRAQEQGRSLNDQIRWELFGGSK